MDTGQSPQLSSKNKALNTYLEKMLENPRLFFQLKAFRDHLYKAENGPRIEESRHGCYRFKGGGTIRDGYPFFKFLEAGRYLKVIAILHFLSNPYSHRTDPSFEYSHLCSRRYCVNPNHIILESRFDNSQRRRCVRLNKCVCDDINATRCVFHR